MGGGTAKTAAEAAAAQAAEEEAAKAAAAEAAAEKALDDKIKPSDLPEVDAYMWTLVTAFLARHKLYEQCGEAAGALAEHTMAFNRRSLDIFTAKAFASLSLSHEALGTLSSVRPRLLAAHRTACLRHDEFGQATLLNLLLRNYLQYNLYTLAEKLRSKAAFPDAVSNSQFVRHLYYRGRIKAVQLDYGEAHADVLQALRKAPAALKGDSGFRRAVHKLEIVVKLLMGDIPDRSAFSEPALRAALRPYFAITNAVRVGDLRGFNAALAADAEVFKADGNYSLILRLRHNVLKTGLRKICTSYSRISFVDIAERLVLDSAEDAEFLCAKAIRDGVIDATLDHEAGHLASNDTADVYSTSVPQQAFHTRISFCLDVHNEAVKSMRYPPDAHKKGFESPEEMRLREEAEQQLAEALEEEDDMDDMDDEPGPM